MSTPHIELLNTGNELLLAEFAICTCSGLESSSFLLGCDFPVSHSAGWIGIRDALLESFSRSRCTDRDRRALVRQPMTSLANWLQSCWSGLCNFIGRRWSGIRERCARRGIVCQPRMERQAMVPEERLSW